MGIPGNRRGDPHTNLDFVMVPTNSYLHSYSGLSTNHHVHNVLKDVFKLD